MTPEMQQALVEISTFHAPEPTVVFRRIVELLAAHYAGTMAAINLIDGERLHYREAANLHPAFQGRTSILLKHSY